MRTSTKPFQRILFHPILPDLLAAPWSFQSQKFFIEGNLFPAQRSNPWWNLTFQTYHSMQFWTPDFSYFGTQIFFPFPSKSKQSILIASKVDVNN